MQDAGGGGQGKRQPYRGSSGIEIPAPPIRHPASSLQLLGATANNLQDVDVDIPLHAFVCVTGVSGSGKSSLVVDTLARALARKLNGAEARPAPYRSLRGANQIDRLVEVDQSPIGRTPRSNPATYTGVWNDIRRVFAGTKQSRQRGYGIGRFSFNAKGGRCEACQGQGVRRISMNFLPDLEVTCPVCRGARFNRQTLSVRFRDKSVADVLAMSISDATEFFEDHEAIRRVLATLVDVGLGYLTLGQPSSTLSGGEAQRIKLATELSRGGAGHTLYILDEPTTGLHSADIRRLLTVLNRLVDQGNSVLVIEHNLDVIKSADWVIDLGPEGGAGGGRIVAAGTPEQVAQCAESHTGRFLRDVLAERA
jgi:excinuclease ABC subunit A